MDGTSVGFDIWNKTLKQKRKQPWNVFICFISVLFQQKINIMCGNSYGASEAFRVQKPELQSAATEHPRRRARERTERTCRERVKATAAVSLREGSMQVPVGGDPDDLSVASKPPRSIGSSLCRNRRWTLTPAIRMRRWRCHWWSQLFALLSNLGWKLTFSVCVKLHLNGHVRLCVCLFVRLSVVSVRGINPIRWGEKERDVS